MVHSGSMTTQLPGWYPDASLPGYERWWDGNAWSPVTRAVPEQTGMSSVFGAPIRPEASGQQPGQGAPEQAAPAAPVWGSPDSAAQPSAPDSFQSPAAPSGQPGRPEWAQPGQSDQPSQSGQYGSDPYASSGQAPFGAPQAPRDQYPGYPQQGAPPTGTPYGGYPSSTSYGQAGAGPYGGGVGPGQPASRFARLIARIVDGILVGIVTAVLGASFLRDVLNAVRDYIDSIPSDGSQPPDPTALLSDPVVTSAIMKYSLVALLVGGVYHVTLIALRGATLGKSLLGVTVQRLADQGRPTWTDAVLRWATTDIPGLIPTVGGLYSLLDALWCLWDPKRQCIHDKLPKTVVVRSR